MSSLNDFQNWSAASLNLNLDFYEVTFYPKVTAIVIILSCLFFVFLSVTEQAVGGDKQCMYCQEP